MKNLMCLMFGLALLASPVISEAKKNKGAKADCECTECNHEDGKCNHEKCEHGKCKMHHKHKKNKAGKKAAEKASEEKPADEEST